MKCKFCGSKIGIYERWRYGDFCSGEHKDDFARDLQSLNEQIVHDLRRIPARLRGEEEAEEPAHVHPETQPELPDPPEGEFIPAMALEAVRPAPAQEARREAPAPRDRSADWKTFAKIAAWDELPVAQMAASKKKQSRFIWIKVSEEPVEGPGGNLVAAEAPAFLPSPEFRRFQVRMQAASLASIGHPAGVAGTKWSASAPSSGSSTWIDDQGWRWIPEGQAAVMPHFGSVLADYPMRAPWMDWEFVAPGRGAAPGREMARPGMAGMPPGMPGYGALPFVSSYPMPEMAPEQALAMQGQGMVPAEWNPQRPPQGFVNPVAWRMIPPPLFNALVDVAHGLGPMMPEPGFMAPDVEPLGFHVELPLCPFLQCQLSSGLALVDCQDDLSGEERPCRREPAVRRPALNTLWRRHLCLPAIRLKPAQRRVPLHAAPAIRLVLGSPCELPPPGIELFAGRRAG
jgi:hypothetical protein